MSNIESTVSPSDPVLTPPYVPDVAATEFPPGTVLKDRYVVERTLGRGGMGQVYLAHDRVLTRPTAVKVIRPRDPQLRNRSIAEDNLRSAFLEEARIGANLTHPAIATVYDFGFHDVEPFIVFEYIAGETLRELLQRRGRLPLEEVRLILGPLAQALQFAHSRHVVHRDLKPENIRSTAQGHFKILDLGLAREFRNELDWTFAGTPAYASPEQAAGLPCDGRTDQYALALIVHEMLTGRWVFEHSDWRELLKLHRDQEAPSSLLSLSDLPASVGSALLRALQKDPNRRFSGCEEFAVALGCQLLTVPTPQPELLRLAALTSMRGLWDTARFRLIRTGTGAFLGLARDALWIVYQGEIHHWPLQAFVELRRFGAGVNMRLRRADAFVQQSFEFRHAKECQECCDLLLELKSRLPAEDAPSADWPPVEPVVLMRRPPAVRYQALGGVEYQDATRGRAEAGLQIRAAMMGADAVVDVQEERLPQLGRTVHRRSGLAVRAVDAVGRREIRMRWFAAQAGWLTRWMLLLNGVVFIATLLGSVLLQVTDFGLAGAPSALHENFLQELGWLFVVVVAMQVVPFTLILLARRLQWPQLLKPAVIALTALTAKPLAGLLGWLAAGLLHGTWAGGLLFGLSVLDPINLAMLVVAAILCRRTWQLCAEYARLAPDAEVPVPAVRRGAGWAALAAAVLFALLLGGQQSWAWYYRISHVAFLPSNRRLEAEALEHFKKGAALLAQNPQAAEAELRRALRNWQELTAAAPLQPEYRHNLAATHHNLGAAFARRGRIAEAIESYRQAVLHFDRLSADTPTYDRHRADRQTAQQSLTSLLRNQPFLEETAAAQEARALEDAGRWREAAESHRSSVAQLQQRQAGFNDQTVYRNLLLLKLNRLAWFLANCPDPQVRDPHAAVEAAQKTLEIAPEEGAYWNTLGAAHYRAGNWKECTGALEKSMQLRRGGDPMDWLFLAMASHKLGKDEEAREHLNRSRDWIAQMEQGKIDDPLRRLLWVKIRRDAVRLRQEAEEMIQTKPQ
jgi:tetratricopeptide (TPR) repeat protein/tRNA A-37 threonylcarbamoyl transferase component Bud32